VPGARTATVVGGGIAGLASAVSLAQAGWQATVLERAPEFGEVGAGLAVTGNGMTALGAIGVADAVRAAGYQTSTEGYQSPDGRWLMRIPDVPSLRRITTIWGLHRQRLHAALLAAARAAGVELINSAEVTGVEPGEVRRGPARVTWRAGETGHRRASDLVVAADGVRSTVRAQLFPGAPARYSGSTCWLAVIPDTGTDGRLVEGWGPEAEFGHLRISDGELCWFGYFRHPAGASFGDELAAARDRFAGWSPQTRAIIAATTADRLMRHDVYYLPRGLHTYVRGRVVMVGDAAHAALPTVGGGASTALEDGVCVGRLIGAPVRDGADLGAALAGFDLARRPRCQKIGRLAAMTARFGCDLGGGWRQPARNALLRLAPPKLLMRAGTLVVDWTPPP
jgi:2-polyprenyl-6-methoxyphenol hydroxylase-like FAD-dependent oxidoreductase